MKKQEPELVLPKQEAFFSTEKLKRSARTGTTAKVRHSLVKNLVSESIALQHSLRLCDNMLTCNGRYR